MSDGPGKRSQVISGQRFARSRPMDHTQPFDFIAVKPNGMPQIRHRAF